jgi:transcriptional regulator with XRE-family HTH domain
MLSHRATGARLRALRIDRGLSPEQLAWRLGISGRTIRRVEDGRLPYPRTQFAIASFFEMRPSELWPADAARRVPQRRKVAA